MKKENFFLFFFLSLILIYPVSSLVSTATTTISNELPTIHAISISGTYLKTIQLKISDKNGIDDIEYVMLKIYYLEDDREISFDKFGDGFIELELIDSSDTSGIYRYDFELDTEDKKGTYRVRFKIKDSGDEITLDQDFSFTPASTPAGAFIQAPTESFLKKPFLRFISAIKRLFRWGES